MNDKINCPDLAVDIIIEMYKDKSYQDFLGIVLIERKYEPYGIAIPGGHVDYGESVEDAAVREALEETSLDVELLKQFRVYSNPERDPRKHTVSLVYIARSYGEPIAMDDAKEAKIYGLDNLPQSLVFDHSQILEDYLSLYKKSKIKS